MYRLYRFTTLLLALGFMVLGGIYICGRGVFEELSTESAYRARLGEGWQLEFERDHGSLTTARVKIVVGVVGIVAITSLLIWVCRVLMPVDHSRHKNKAPQKSRKRKYGSSLERRSHYRRNAFLGNYFGVSGILAGVFLVIFRTPLFMDHDNQVLLGLLVFLAGYVGVIAACRLWLISKSWNDAIVFIALMPLGVLLIPYVRLVYLAAPMLLPAGMVMMPLILIVVVMVLPDKSGVSRSRHR